MTQREKLNMVGVPLLALIPAEEVMEEVEVFHYTSHLSRCYVMPLPLQGKSLGALSNVMELSSWILDQAY